MTTFSLCRVSDLVLTPSNNGFQQRMLRSSGVATTHGSHASNATSQQGAASRQGVGGKRARDEMTCFRKLLRRTMGPVLAVGSWQARHHSTAQQSTGKQSKAAQCSACMACAFWVVSAGPGVSCHAQNTTCRAIRTSIYVPWLGPPPARQGERRALHGNLFF